MIGKRKRPADFDAKAASVVADATAESAPEPEPEKDPTAVARGRLGGTTRAFRLSARRRREIAQLAVKARWDAAEDKQDG